MRNSISPPALIDRAPYSDKTVSTQPLWCADLSSFVERLLFGGTERDVLLYSPPVVQQPRTGVLSC
jgi:hypothetical protein